MLRPYAAFCLRLGESPRYTARLLDNVMYVHDRRSLRLNGYDYAQAGAYFVTICTQDRACLFGDIVDGEVRLTDAGRMVQVSLAGLPGRFPAMELDAFVIMPNHVHGIIVIRGRGELVFALTIPATGFGRSQGSPLRNYGGILARIRALSNPRLQIHVGNPRQSPDDAVWPIVATQLLRARHSQRARTRQDTGIHRHQSSEMGAGPRESAEDGALSRGRRPV